MRYLARLSSMLALGALALGVSRSSQAASLKVGMAPPPLKVAKWVKGDPVSSFEKGKLYVVEFWATWCGPCKVSIPHLTEMAKKYAGKVTFTGVSVAEDHQAKTTGSTAYMTKVVSFVKDMGDKMAYNVAVDDPKETMLQTWMEAAGQNGIPTAFVIDRDTKIAWIGHPMMGLDEVLAKEVDGTFDPAAEAKRQEDQQAKQQELQQAVGGAISLVRSGKTDEGISAFDKLVAQNAELKEQLRSLEFSTVAQADEPAAYKLATRLANGPEKNDPGILNDMAWTIAQGQNLKHPDLPLALTLARRAVELSKSQNGSIMDTLGYVLFKSGKLDEAISVQEKAVALIDKDATVPAEQKKEIADRLKQFKAEKNRI